MQFTHDAAPPLAAVDNTAYDPAVQVVHDELPVAAELPAVQIWHPKLEPAVA